MISKNRSGASSAAPIDPGEANGQGPTGAQKRARAIWVITLGILVVCGVQLFNIQIVKGTELAEQGRIVRTKASKIEAPRGSIVDATGQVMVDTVKTYHIAVNQKNILEYRHYDEDGVLVGSGPAEAALLLAPLLDRDPSELGGAMLGDQLYVYLAKDVDQQTYRAIRKLGIYGIEWEPSFERLYPGGSTAATVLGTVSADGLGNSGLELTFDELLTGVPGEESYETGPTGEVIPGAKVVTREATGGATLHTSIHADLQHSVQTVLDKYVAQFQAEWGAVVILDVATSRVLVLADSNQADPTKGPQSSHAVQMVYEPGSVGKVPTFASALENGIIDPLTPFSVPDRYTVPNGQVFRDATDHEVLDMTATGVLAASLNTGTVMIGEQMSDQTRYELFKRLGFGEITGIELPGESGGLLTEPETWDGRTRYTTMFGQGYALNALQAAAMVAALGNDGVWTAPRLVDGWTTADGVYHEATRPTPREAVRPEVASTLLNMMESVVSSGGRATGTLAQVDGYRIAAKTGTAEIGDGRLITNMAGVLPADDPQIAIALVLYAPAVYTLSGTSAAPMFAEVASAAVQNLGIAPSAEPARLYPTSRDGS